jgi:3-hydroxyisobutyrate dehydrogenase
MASNLLKHGHTLLVHDLFRDSAQPLLDAGAQWANSPVALAEASEVVFTSLPTPDDVEAIAAGPAGLAKGLRPGSAWFDLSTNSVDVVRRLHAELSQQGIAFLDAPVSGGPAGAASGNLAIWVGGDEAVFRQHAALLGDMSDGARYIGGIGAGTVAKLVHNCASAALTAVLAEVFTLGVKADVDPLTLWETVRDGALGRNRTFDLFGRRFLPGRFDPPSFRLSLVHKDVRLALELANQLNVPMPLCSGVLAEIGEAVDRGWGGRDSYSFTLLQQERAGIVPVSVPVEAIRAAEAR